ncbi:RNA recognition motif domain-containing protein [Prochlorothrix hollandica]|uniref:RNA-binding protein n=1 Tax=Prochlorothrix hollandica PCC 9006 = CALU 1027 TaxID=317619 RepID=A0A0M2PTG7_PROHO|nr:RNA-binding protein [Prochlorothrix hollandica]KKI99404.1 RNA-binding protein [Prochlorothrix hollandica PCC 9006 = CALU 1027]
MPIRLYVGNLPKELERQELEDVFADAGDTLSTKIITDRKTGKCRGFGFVTVQTDEQADEIIEKYSGYVLKDSTIKIEKALPRAKGKPGDAPAPEPVASPISNRKKATKARRTPGTPTTTSVGGSEGFQPDPRWAQDLERLKDMLASAQTTGS